MTVFHTKFGIGTVVSQDEKNVTVNFSGVEKVMIIRFAGLKKEDGSDFGVQFESAPKKAKKRNEANYMTKADLLKTEIGRMTDEQFRIHCEKAKWASKSW